MSSQERLIDDKLEALRDENHELIKEVEGLRQFMEAMDRLMEAVESPQREAEVTELLGQVLDNALRAISAEDGSLLVPDERTGELVFLLVRGKQPQEKLLGLRLPPGKGVAAWVV